MNADILSYVLDGRKSDETTIYKQPLSDLNLTLRKVTYLIESDDDYKLMCGIRIRI